MNDLVELPHADPGETTVITRVFTTMADETRLKIVKLLSEREYGMDELVWNWALPNPRLPTIYRYYKEAGIVRGEKRGGYKEAVKVKNPLLAGLNDFISFCRLGIQTAVLKQTPIAAGPFFHHGRVPQFSADFYGNTTGHDLAACLAYLSNQLGAVRTEGSG